MWSVYIIKSLVDKRYYVGSTNDVERRLSEHNKKLVRSTKAFAPLDLVFIRNFEDEKSARSYERKLKDCRREKEKIIKELEN
jgi:putative endonuclease